MENDRDGWNKIRNQFKLNLNNAKQDLLSLRFLRKINPEDIHIPEKTEKELQGNYFKLNSIPPCFLTRVSN